MNLHEAAKAALEALEALQGGCTDHNDGTVEALTVWCPEIIDQLRAALAAEPPQRQPLTDKQLANIYTKYSAGNGSSVAQFKAFRAVERAQGIGEQS